MLRRTCFSIFPPSRWARSGDAPGSRAVEQQANRRCIFGLGKFFGHTLEAARRGHAHGQIEHALGQFDQAVQMRAAAGQHEAGGDLRFEAAALQFVANQREQFLRARLDDFVQHARENGARRAVADAGDLDGDVFAASNREDAAMLALDFFGFGNRRAQADGKIVGEMIAADREWPPRGAACRRKTTSSVVPPPISSRQQPSSRSSCVRQDSAEAKRLENRVGHSHARLIHGDHEILHGRAGGGDDVHVDFEALADHAHRVANIVVRVEQKFLREHVQHYAIFGQSDIARGIHGVANIVALDVARRVPERDSAAAVHSANMAAGNADERGLDGHADDGFGLFNGAANRADGKIEIDDLPVSSA